MSNYHYTNFSSLRFALLLLLALAGQALFAQNKTWTNGNGTGNWNDPGNWSPAGIPTSASRIIFDDTNGDNCTIDIDPTIARLTIETGYTGIVGLGSKTLTMGGNLIVESPGNFDSGTGKVLIGSASRIDCAAPLYDLEIDAGAASRVSVSQDLEITNSLLIEQVGALGGSFAFRVGGDITVNDPDLANAAYIVATGSGALSGSGVIRRLRIEAGASLSLAGSFTLDNNFDLEGDGSITGAGKLILGSDGNLDFSGSVPNVEINTNDPGLNISLNQPFVISGSLTITEIGDLNGGSEIRVGGDIAVDDPDVAGNSYIVATGSGALSGAGALRRLRVEGGASLSLANDFTLASNFRLEGAGMITGANRLVLGSNGHLDFSGTVSNVLIHTAAANQSITLDQNFNITGTLEISQLGGLNGSGREMIVNGDIAITDMAVTGTASMTLGGSGTTSFEGAGGGAYRRLIVRKSSPSGRAELNSSDSFLSVTIDEGVLDLNGQTLDGPVTVNDGGTLGGFGTVNDDVTVNPGGIISPGSSPGVMTINGDLTVNGTLVMEIVGEGDGGGGSGVAGVDFDQVVVTGNANINTLSIVFTGALSATPPTFPTSGQTYTLISGSASVTNVLITPANINAVVVGGMLFIGNPAFPIELTEFSAVAKGGAIHLYWRTATEQNNDYMAVERSADGIRFEELGRVKGAGSTEVPQEYRFADDKPLPGLSYYRLRQVDFDGAFEYHRAISVWYEGKNGRGLEAEVSPNPAQDHLRIRWAPDAGQATTLRLFNSSGQLLATYRPDAGAGSYEISLGGLPAGLYFLQASRGHEVEVLQFVRQ